MYAGSGNYIIKIRNLFLPNSFVILDLLFVFIKACWRIFENVTKSCRRIIGIFFKIYSFPVFTGILKSFDVKMKKRIINSCDLGSNSRVTTWSLLFTFIQPLFLNFLNYNVGLLFRKTGKSLAKVMVLLNPFPTAIV